MKRDTQQNLHNSSQDRWFSGIPFQLVMTNAIFIIAFWVGGLFFLYADYRNHLESANQQAIDATSRYFDNAWLIMNNIDSILRATNQWLNSNPEADDLNDFLAKTAESYPFVRTVIVTLPNGDIIGDSRPDTPAVGVNIADREYFRNVVDGHIIGLDIDAPVKSRVDGAWSTPVSRASYDDDGNLQWVVNAAFDPVYFAQFYLPNETDRIDKGFILNDYGDMLATIPFDDDLLNTSFLEFEFVQNQASLNTRGHFQGQTLLGDGQSIISYQRAQDYPITIITQIDLSSVIQPVLKDGIVMIAVVLLLSTITTTMTYRQIQKDRALRLQMRLREQSEDEARTLAENITDLIARFDRDLRHIYVNPAVTKMTGLSVNDYLGKTNRELGMPEDQVIVWERETLKVFETGQPNNVEFSYLSPDGHRHLLAHLTPEFNADGRVKTVLSVVRDITDRKQVEEEIQIQLRYQSAATELSLHALRVPDLQSFMDQFVQILARTLDVEFSKILELLSDGENLLLRAGVGWNNGLVGEVLVDTGLNSQAGYTLRANDPVIVADLNQETRFKGPALLTEHGVISGMSLVIHTFNEAYGVVGVHSDQHRNFTTRDIQFLENMTGLLSLVIERQRAEDALRQSEERWRSLTEYSPEHVLTINRDLNIQFANYASPGLTVDTLIGNPLYTYVDPEMQTMVKEKLQSVLETGERTSYETVYHAPDGDIFYESVASAIWDKDEIVGVTVSARNVTERKLAEMQLHELTEQLEKKVKERTRKLEDVNKELSDFAYVVSHDLKAPLRGITQLGGWLAEDYADQLDDEAQNMVNLMVTRTRRMHRLIEGILQYSRIGRITEQHASIDLNQLLRETVELLAPPESITIRINDLPSITGEPTRIQQLFQNLISNAIKYMDKPEGLVEISAVDLTSHWQFSVRDNGPGIAEKYYEKVFQIFQSLQPLDAVESTGIGLAIAKKIVDVHHGRIWIESKVGEGTTFFFTLAKTLETASNAE